MSYIFVCQPVFGLDWADFGRYIAPTLRLGRSQVVRHRFLVSCIVGSNPTAPARVNLNNPEILYLQVRTGWRQRPVWPTIIHMAHALTNNQGTEERE